jgi:hypothetical protein
MLDTKRHYFMILGKLTETSRKKVRVRKTGKLVFNEYSFSTNPGNDVHSKSGSNGRVCLPSKCEAPNSNPSTASLTPPPNPPTIKLNFQVTIIY